MKHFSKQLSKFVVVVMFVYGTCVLITGQPFVPYYLKPNLPYVPNLTALTFADVKRKSNVDVLFVGSSHCYRGFDTRLFASAGLSSFNLGSSSQTPLHSAILLKRYLPTLRPGVIIFEVYPLMFSRQVETAEGSINIIANERLHPFLFQLLFTAGNIQVYNSILFKLVSWVVGSEPETKVPLQGVDERYVGNGYVEKELAYYQPTPHGPVLLEFDPVQFAALNKIKALALQYNCKLVLVFAPVTKSLYKAYVNKDTFENRMMQQGVFFNFNNRPEYIDSLHFYDDNHLNQKGVDLFNKQLIPMLHK